MPETQQLELFPQKTLTWVYDQPPIEYYPNFLPAAAADLLYEHCKRLDWRHNKIRMLGKWLDLPRLEVMLGDSEEYRYLYSGSVELIAKPWTPLLHFTRHQVEQVTGFRYQLVIGNYYRSGSDHIGWHSDNETSMGESPAIASISLGETRRFQLKPKKVKQEPVTYDLTHGSLILMLPGCQENWLHRLCKTAKPVGERINLTFRPYMEAVK